MELYNGRFLASASGDHRSKDKTVHVLEREKGKQIQIYRGYNAPVQHVQWLDHDQLASKSNDNIVHVWDKTTGKRMLPKKCRCVLFIGDWKGLILKDADFSGAVGLAAIDKALILQRGGLVEKPSEYVYGHEAIPKEHCCCGCVLL